MLIIPLCRLLGTTEIQLGEVISKGKHTVKNSLKGKKGDQLTVCVCVCVCVDEVKV